MAWDRYAYVNNNPLNYMDSTGHWPEWADWLIGAGSQYTDDMSFGLFSAVTGNLDYIQNNTFQDGRRAGRVVSSVVAVVDIVSGAAVIGAAAAGLFSTTGLSLAAAPLTGGGSVAIGSIVGTGEMVIGLMGVAEVGYGLGVFAKISGDPLGGSSRLTFDDLLNNPSAFSGKTQAEIEALIPKSWEKSQLARGEGVRYLNPEKPGQALFFNKGIPNASDILHSGPYLKVSNGTGKPIRIPLAGNPILPK